VRQGAKYEVVKNTLARIAVKGTQFEDVSGHFKGVTAIAWTENDPVVLTKAISKFMKDNADLYTFKTGVVDGSLVDLAQLTTIANLPSKEELMSKLLFVLNAQAQRLVTVISAVPRNLAIVVKQIGDQEGRATGTTEPVAEAAAPEPAAEAAEAQLKQRRRKKHRQRRQRLRKKSLRKHKLRTMRRLRWLQSRPPRQARRRRKLRKRQLPRLRTMQRKKLSVKHRQRKNRPKRRRRNNKFCFESQRRFELET
jgi:large subunit ribosomal protein L10